MLLVTSSHCEGLTGLLFTSIYLVPFASLLSYVSFPDYMLIDGYKVQAVAVEPIVKLCFAYRTRVKLILPKQVLIPVSHGAKKLII